MSPSMASNHGCSEPGEVPLSPYQWQPQLGYPIPHCGAGWAPGAFLLHRNARARLGEELVASYLYQVHLYHWLEANDYGRFLSDQDL
jgi:hypothetical protein